MSETPAETPIPVEVKPRRLRRPGDIGFRWNTDNLMLIRLLRFCAWLNLGYAKILDRDRDRMIPLIHPRLGQLKLIEAMLDQAKARQPIRVLIPKARRQGISTILQLLFYFTGWSMPRRNLRTVAHTGETAENIFSIASICNDGHPKQSGMGVKASDNRIKFYATKSSYACWSGIAQYAGSGDTIHELHVSEFAKFMNTSEQDRRAMRSMVNAVAQTRADTVIAIESSGQGPTGEFPERCRAAERKEGSYKLVFVPWIWDTALTLDEDGIPEEFDPPLAGHELLLKKMGATDGQIAWRRKKIADDFPGYQPHENPPGFAWDYPLVLEDCFTQKSGRVYPSFSINRHVREDAHPTLELRRCIDWGFSETSAFVCLWLAIDRSQPPQVIVHPRCENFIAEHLNYSRDPKTGKPLKTNDHTCDAFRYGVVTFRIQCLVYVYRELFAYCADQDGAIAMARKIHTMSGWFHPDGPKGMDMSKYKRGHKGEVYQIGCADKAMPWLIQEYGRFGLPLMPYTKPDPNDSSQGVIEDGIQHVSMLFGADAFLRSKGVDKQQIILDAAIKKIRGEDTNGRGMTLSAEESRVVKAARSSYLNTQPAGSGGRTAKKMARSLRRL